MTLTLKCVHLKSMYYIYPSPKLQNSMKCAGTIFLTEGNWSDKEVLETETPPCSWGFFHLPPVFPFFFSNPGKVFQLGFSWDDNLLLMKSFYLQAKLVLAFSEEENAKHSHRKGFLMVLWRRPWLGHSASSSSQTLLQPVKGLVLEILLLKAEALNHSCFY